MASTTYSPYSSRYQAVAGLGYDGVVRISFNSYYATGVLLNDGRTILTAAHLYGDNDNSFSTTEVFFETNTQNKISCTIESLAIHPYYNSSTTGADLALIHLSQSAFLDAERYGIYRENNIEDELFTMVGYGRAGTGEQGVETDSDTPTRRMADNTIDGDVEILNYYLNTTLGWNAPNGTQFIADFDNGNHLNDAAGTMMNHANAGVGSQEGIISSGDSGGPAFIDDRIVGIATYTTSLHKGDIYPDVDDISNSSYGEIAAWQKLSYYQEWIDKQQRISYENAPTSRQAVVKEVTEGSSGTTYAYFLLQFTGIRSNPDQILSVDYTTRNGTALAGEDYIYINDTLNLYPDETQAVIAVEIIGDNHLENDETFYLDVTNPIGGNFADNAVMLTAMRTILNDDFIA